jgi:hypothetical protein
MTMAETGNQRGKRMWPAPQTADFLFALSNVALIIGLALTVVATIGSVWMANVREGYLKHDLAEADRRSAEANAAGEEARAAASEANARASEAALQLEKFRAPRTLNDEQLQRIVSRVREFAGQEYRAVLTAGGFDVRNVWIALNKALTTAGWSRMPPPGVAFGEPPAGIAAGSQSGIVVAIAVAPPLARRAGVVPAARALTEALDSVGLDARMELTGDHNERKPNIITIHIGLKPQ